MLPAAAIAVGVLAVAPAAASAAGTVAVTNSGTEVQFDAGAGDTNVITATTAPGTISIRDTGAAISTADPLCTTAGDTVTCTVATLQNFELNLGDMDDQATGAGPLSGEFSGALGNDTLTGSNDNTISDFLGGEDGNDILNTGNVGTSPIATDTIGDSASGGSGNDVVTGGNGSDGLSGGDDTDVVNGGPGDDGLSGDGGDNDNVQGGDGNDSVTGFGSDGTGDVQDGGPGIDELSYFDSTGTGPGLVPDDFAVALGAGTASRTNNSPPANSDAATNFEDATTDSGNDTITGTDGSNRLFASGGNDVVNPGAGTDTLELGAGDDQSDTRDGFVDRVLCGAGNDSVQVDQLDEAVDCETAAVTQTTPAGADVKAPGCQVSQVRRSYAHNVFFRGFNVRVACDEAASLLIQVVTRFRPGLFSARAGDVVLAERSVNATANTTTRVRPLRQFKRRLRRKGFRVQVRVTAQDGAQNRSVTQKTARVKKAKVKRRRQG